MDTQCTAAANPAYTMNFSGGALGSGNGDGVMSEEEEQEEEDDEEEQPGGGNGRTTAGGVSAPAQTHWSSNTEGETETSDQSRPCSGTSA